MLIYQLFVLEKEKVGQKEKVRIFPGRKAWKDALATQALRPELQKARPYGLAVESKRKHYKQPQP